MAAAHPARAVVSFFSLGRFSRRCRKKMNQGMNYADAVFLVYKENHPRSTDCTTNHAYVAAIYRVRENSSGRYQCFFNRFNPV